MTTLYYLPADRIAGDRANLPEDEARHAVQVLRHREGDQIQAVDGSGGWYRIELTHVSRGEAVGQILERRREVGEPSVSLTVCMALLKSPKRFDVFVEKASELGVTHIVPLVTARTEKRSFNTERVEKKLIAAMKQCGRSRRVHLADVQALDDLLDRQLPALALCCHEKAPPEQGLLYYLQRHASYEEAMVLIGPEGGFTDEEVEMAVRRGVDVVSLGTRRLRSETAAIAASTGFMLYCP